MNKSRLMLLGSLLLIVAVFITAVYLSQKQKKELLPVYGMDEETLKPPIIPDFNLTDQNGNKVTLATTNNHIFIANFFFAKCQGICPAMNNQLARVYAAYKGDKEVLFLSHTVKPEEDSVAALKEYAALYKADASQWLFLTGPKAEIYNLARDNYKASVDEGNGGPDDFVHTQMLTLVDKEKRLRGFYDGLDSTQVNQLIKDVQILLDEYH